jgi:hypothetical protein
MGIRDRIKARHAAKTPEEREAVKDEQFTGQGKRIKRAVVEATENTKRRREESRERSDNKFSLGGSKKAQGEIIGEARQGAAEGRGEHRTASQDLDYQQDVTRDREAQFMDEYGQSRTDLRGDIGAQRGNIGNIAGDVNQAAGILGAGATQASNILGQAQGANQLTGTAENILGQRAAAMAANPSYAQLANDAIAAQTQGVQDQTNFAQGQLARRAMGMAAGSGEGGALNAQQAMASLVGGGADMAVQANLANQQNAAAQRAQAVMAQRGESVGEADYASQARLGAAGTERQNQLATAQAQSGIATNAATGQAGLIGNRAIQTQNALQGLTGTGQGATNTAGSMQQGAGTLAGGLTKTEVDAGTANKATELKSQADILVGGANAAALAEANKPRGLFRGLRGRR